MHPIGEADHVTLASNVSMISSLDHHLSALYRLRRFGIQFGLSTITHLMRGLGNPQKRYSCIHVGGTNGKGSIAALLSSILFHAGYKVGLYTSPHLVRFNERIQINGHSISDQHVAAAAEAVRQIYTQGDLPTFFECATAMAFHHFALEKVDWAILEAGMGGRYDATNIVYPQVSIISNVAMDHTEYLGNTLAKIASEKAGIIKRGVGVVTGTKQKKALHVIEQAAIKKGAPLRRLGKEIKIRKEKNGPFTYLGPKRQWRGVKVGLLGGHQIDNAALALGALEILMEKGLRVPDETTYNGLATARWPGRLEVVSEDPFILLDGAHNPFAAKMLRKFLENLRASHRLILVIGILRDKAWKAILRQLLSVADYAIITQPQSDRAADPNTLASFAHHIIKDVDVVPRVPDAISLALKRAADGAALCITGSLYTVGEAKAYFLNRHALR